MMLNILQCTEQFPAPAKNYSTRNNHANTLVVQWLRH